MDEKKQQSPWQQLGISEAEYRARGAGGAAAGITQKSGRPIDLSNANQELPPVTDYKLADLGGQLQIKIGTGNFVPLTEKSLAGRKVEFNNEDIIKFGLVERGFVAPEPEPAPAPAPAPVQAPPPKPQANLYGAQPAQQIFQSLQGGGQQDETARILQLLRSGGGYA